MASNVERLFSVSVMFSCMERIVLSNAMRLALACKTATSLVCPARFNASNTVIVRSQFFRVERLI